MLSIDFFHHRRDKHVSGRVTQLKNGNCKKLTNDAVWIFETKVKTVNFAAIICNLLN
jgi:hypothetical protein